MTRDEGAGTTAAPAAGAGFEARVRAFAARASLEITSADRSLPDSLAGRLPAGAALYVAHVPGTSLADVVETACIAERAGFRGCPHIVARRIASRGELDAGLARMQAGGVRQALLVAGDQTPPAGPFPSTLEIIESGALEAAGIAAIGVAGHPQGNAHIGPAQLREALQRKQAFAARTGVAVHIVTQFGFNPEALAAFDRQLAADGIELPVHAGVAGPASLKGLAKFAMLCGIGASLAALIANPAALGTLVRTVDEIFPAIVRLREGALARRIVQPHFFAFGGVMKTVEWLEAVRAGRFDLDPATGSVAIRN